MTTSTIPLVMMLSYGGNFSARKIGAGDNGQKCFALKRRLRDELPPARALPAGAVGQPAAVAACP